MHTIDIRIHACISTYRRGQEGENGGAQAHLQDEGGEGEGRFSLSFDKWTLYPSCQHLIYTHRHTQIHTNDELKHMHLCMSITHVHVCMSMQRVHRVALKIESETPIPKPITAAQFKEIKKELVRTHAFQEYSVFNR